MVLIYFRYFVSLVAASFILGSVMVLGYGGELSDLVDVKKLNEKITLIEPDLSRLSLVLDSSMILSYNPMNLMSHMRRYGNVYVPEKVLNELPSFRTREIVMLNSKKIEGFERYREIAKGYLDRGKKNIVYKSVLAISRGEKKYCEFNKRERRWIKNEIENVEVYLIDSGENIFLLPEWKLKERILNKMEKHYKTSETDVDVLAYAINQAMLNKHALIGGKDRDFGRASRLIKKECSEEIKNNIDYLTLHEVA